MSNGALEPLDSTLDLPRVAHELLPQPDGCRVLQMSPSGLDDRHELTALVPQRRIEVGHRGEKAVLNGAQGGNVNRRGDHVVGRLPDVHVIVRVDGVPRASLATQHLNRAVRYHLIGVHVCRGTGTRLEDIDHELVVVPALCNLCRRLADGVRKVLVEQSQIRVDLGRGQLDLPDGLDERPRKAEVAYREILHRSHRLRAVVSIDRHFEFAHGVSLDSQLSILGHHSSLESLRPQVPVHSQGNKVCSM